MEYAYYLNSHSGNSIEHRSVNILFQLFQSRLNALFHRAGVNAELLPNLFKGLRSAPDAKIHSDIFRLPMT